MAVRIEAATARMAFFLPRRAVMRRCLHAAIPSPSSRNWIGCVIVLYDACLGPSHHHRQSFGGTGNPGIKPALAAVRKGERLVEQHDVIPL
jgi:hypothetical protein